MNKFKVIKKLSHISLFSKDLKKVEKFYCKILNLKIAHKFINKKNGKIYGLFIYAGENTMLEFFISKKKLNNN